MRDLVVVEVVDVDSPRAAPHLLGHKSGVEVSEQGVGDRTQHRERPAAMGARLEVAAHLPAGLRTLLDDLRPVRLRLLAKPLGQAMNQATARRVCLEPRLTSTLLIVITERGASPVNRLEIETSSSASRSLPSVGRFATRSRPSPGRTSESRNPIDRTVQDAELTCGRWCTASVEATRAGRSSQRRAIVLPWGPLRPARPSAASGTGPRPPARRARPGPPGRRAAVPARRAAQATRQAVLGSGGGHPLDEVPTAATIQLAAKAGAKDPEMAGTSDMTAYRISACPTKATPSTASHPTRADSSTRAGRTRKPTIPVTVATATHAHGVVADRPGNSPAATQSAKVAEAHVTRSRPSPPRGPRPCRAVMTPRPVGASRADLPTTVALRDGSHVVRNGRCRPGRASRQ
jgi:hypothetical protein